MTKFLGKISQFEFLVMTEKNIFVYKLLLLLNISDFNLFYVKVATPLKKVTTSFPANPSKGWGPVKPALFWKFGWRLTPLLPRLQKEGCVCACPRYVFITLIITNFWKFQFNYYELFNEENLLKILFIKFEKSMNYRYKKDYLQSFCQTAY